MDEESNLLERRGRLRVVIDSDGEYRRLTKGFWNYYWDLDTQRWE